MNRSLKYVIQGIALALLVFLSTSSVVSVMLTDAHAQGAPLFSVTLIAPTGGNTVRRQYASIIASNMINLGIDAKLFYVNFDQLINRMYFTSVDQGATFDKGGFDMGFLGWVFSPPTPPIPDFAFMLDGRPAYLAPAGDNYVLYNNPELNALFDQLAKTTDTQKQVDLSYKIQEIVFNDKPYNFLFEAVDVVPRDQKWTAWGSKDVYSVMTFPDVQQ
jgi:ABC-type transport system substrate-binding protein